MRERLAAGWHILLILIGIATIAVGFFWPRPKPPPALASAAVSVVFRDATPPVPRKRRLTPGHMTYCPGPNCTVEQKARRVCEEREPRGVFAVEPDFVCKFPDGAVHRMVCDDIDDERQCGMMSHTDLAYARDALVEFFDSRKFVDIDLVADLNEGKLRCTEREREIECSFTRRSSGLEHPDSPVVCNWMGCGFPFAESAD